ncbi:MAG: endonuclease III [Ignavibacteriales bacterium]|nr:endonuclease III [Ignavibacteriales bacterium]
MAKKKSNGAKDLFDQNDDINWNKELKPLFKRYDGRKHPLEYKNLYQLLVAVVLSARDSDRNINSLTPALFAKFPSMKHLAKATPEDLYPFIGKVSNFGNKSQWLTKTAKEIKDDKNIPLTQEGLTQYSGIGRKSANVIMSQMGAPAEGVIVDLHTLRVAPRLGIAQGTNPEKIEKQLMEKVDKKNWHLLGMSLTYLGRETCRPTNPKCHECVVSSVCAFYNGQKK